MDDPDALVLAQPLQDSTQADLLALQARIATPQPAQLPRVLHNLLFAEGLPLTTRITPVTTAEVPEGHLYRAADVLIVVKALAMDALTDAIVERGAPATAVHVREVVLQVFRWAIERGQKVENPAELVRPTTIAKFEPRDRALTPDEIGLMYQYMERIGTTPSIRAAAKLLLLTMVRKSELTNATWSEINFSDALWTIPKERMKRRNPHLVFLSRQALDIFIALKTFAGGSDYVLPSRYDSDTPMSSATLNQVLTLTYRLAQKEGKPLSKFGPHDLRRTASTLLHEAGYNTDWIEKCLAHEQRGVRAVYNKAEYREQRTAMLQDWADMIDEWTLKRPKA